MDDKVRDFIIDWNIRFPIDRRWRKKFNIAFNSPQHRESCFLDQLIDIEEDNLFEELINTEKYKAGTGDWLKRQEPKSLEEDIQSMRDEFKEDFPDEFKEEIDG